jgi:hypothetical protein
MINKTDLNRAIAHAVNYHALDSRLGISDWQLANLLEHEIQKWLDGVTDVQIVERMTLEERRKIGLSPNV